MLDAHCHIDQYKTPSKIAMDADKKGVFTIAMTNLPSHFLVGLPHLRSLKKIRLALGLQVTQTYKKFKRHGESGLVTWDSGLV